MRKKIAVYGGGFDPIHNGHIEIVDILLEKYKMDKVYIVPTAVPPHKSGLVASIKDRIKMIFLAVDKLSRKITVSDYELRNLSVSYTVTTMNYFRKKYPNEDLFFITGSDIFSTIKTWHKYSELLHITKVIVFQREQYSEAFLEEKIGLLYLDWVQEGVVLFDDSKISPISSTEMRVYPKSDNLDAGVLKYMQENNLYNTK